MELSPKLKRAKAFIEATDEPRDFIALQAYKGNISWDYGIPLDLVVIYLNSQQR
jgi:hypothetical protein